MQKNPLGLLLGAAVMLMPFSASAVVGLPKTVEVDSGKVETVCDCWSLLLLPQYRKDYQGYSVVTPVF
jgi:hypothetical protein